MWVFDFVRMRKVIVSFEWLVYDLGCISGL